MSRTTRPWMAAVLALALASSVPASATTGPPLTVRLGVHRFGDLARPDAIVARAPASAVGFENPAEGPANGPWSFDVAADGSVWLLDQFDDRLLVWSADRPDHVGRTVTIPGQVNVAADMALGPDGTIYLSYLPAHPTDPRKRLSVLAMSPAGRVRWSTETDIESFNSVLRFAPDGVLYWAPDQGTDGWTALTDASGSPLNLSEQRSSTLSSQPVGAGRSLEEVGVSQHQTRVSLFDDAGAVLTWWSVTSRTTMYANGATPGMVDGDPVVPLIVQEASVPDTPPKTEYTVVRLAEGVTTPETVNLAYDTTFGDTVITPLRIGPDGDLYQLRSDVRTGVTIARYPLGAAATTPDPTPSSTSSATASADPPTSSASRTFAWWIAGGVAVAIVAAWWVRRRSRGGRHRAA